MKKDIEWLKKEIENMAYTTIKRAYMDDYISISKKGVLELINQLDEPEVLSQEWVDENKTSIDRKLDGTPIYKVREELLQNLLVPKQEEVDQAYKSGYETGKQHTFYKGYLEGLTDKEKEPETVASVIADFFKSLERFKEVISMEVEELEE